MRKWFLSAALLAAQLATAQTATVNTKAPLNWYNLDAATDRVRGVGTEKAYELLKSRKSEPVVVGVIDSGIDVNHEDLKSVIWVNPREIPGNGRDDDRNGYIDDVNGWDFLGGKDGRDIRQETLEATRLYREMKPRFEGKTEKDIAAKDRADYETYKAVKAEVDEKATEAKTLVPMIETMMGAQEGAEKLLKAYLKKDRISPEDLAAMNTDSLSTELKRARSVLKRGFDMGYTTRDLQEGIDHYKAQRDYQVNLDFDPRKDIIGDDPANTKDRNYGNSEVQGPDAEHGTHVAGLIGAVRNNNLGMNGVADNVRIMVVRAVPDGDERDKDVANAIRYAVDNGAKIINMSFGKAYSPQKEAVDEAVKYAETRGVLLVHAAGNESKNIDETANFPNKYFRKGGQAKNWLEVGALSWKPNEVASFSNYGRKGVDLFSPGVDLYSSIPGSKYKENSGTSMAAPVVTGVAALIKSYFPKITAEQLKTLLDESAVKSAEMQVTRPGSEDKIGFGELSSTGGVVNAAEAVKLALQWEKAGKIR